MQSALPSSLKRCLGWGLPIAIWVLLKAQALTAPCFFAKYTEPQAWSPRGTTPGLILPSGTFTGERKNSSLLFSLTHEEWRSLNLGTSSSTSLAGRQLMGLSC